MNTLKQLYQDTIRQHAADPVGYRKSIQPTHHHEGLNPQCGDRMEIFLKISAGRIEDIAFEGEACAICMASASMMCQHVAGQAVATFGDRKRVLERALREPEQPADIGFLSPLLGVRPYPSRIQCATLPWDTAEKALKRGGLGMEKSVQDG
ncbi:MAG: SUF system NifU family Fe-S cluster assembly protein [Xanthomonadales bacterium]|nr:SUF system NifU family Fe-S cluster assembly protein [Xanthomonadales bacterium]